LLQNGEKSSDLTPWKSISKQVRKHTPKRVTVASKFTYPERNRKLRKVHYTGNRNCGFLFYLQILFEAFPKLYSTASLQTRTYFLVFSIIWSPSTCDHFSGIKVNAGQSTWICAGVVFLFSVCLSLSIIIMSPWSFW